jgi:hypothetical protein
MMSVQVKAAQVRGKPSFLGPVVATLAYGDQVEAIQQSGDWAQVRTASRQEGWLHQSALSSKRILLNAGGADAKGAASSQEVALAGKGFNSDVERQFRGKNPNLDFAWVDRMERITVSAQQSVAFLQAGEVRPTGGVQ